MACICVNKRSRRRFMLFPPFRHNRRCAPARTNTQMDDEHDERAQRRWRWWNNDADVRTYNNRFRSYWNVKWTKCDWIGNRFWKRVHVCRLLTEISDTSFPISYHHLLTTSTQNLFLSIYVSPNTHTCTFIHSIWLEVELFVRHGTSWMQRWNDESSEVNSWWKSFIWSTALG